MNAITRFDLFLIFKVFVPVAHWADYRWHLNQYRIAYWFMQLGAGTAILAPFTYFVPPITHQGIFWFAIIFPINILIAYFYLKRCKDLQTADRKWERNPTEIPREAYYYIMVPAFVRLIGVIYTLLFVTPMIFLTIAAHMHWYMVIIIPFTRCWLLFGDSVAPYFAMLPPSPRKRKEKKQEAPMGAIYAGVKG